MGKIEDIKTAERLEEILSEIKSLTLEASDLVRKTLQADRAEKYWIPEILSALDYEHQYLTKAGITMQDTIWSLKDDQ